MIKTLYALHGFLGLSSDWDFLEQKPIAPNLFEGPTLDLWSWAKKFNESIPPNSYLMGYSLGGRLALHALIQSPNLWKAAVIISADPGLENQKAKDLRLKEESRWARRFEKDDWDLLISDWNDRTALKNSALISVRKESDYNRQKLAEALSIWSLGRQENLRARISQLPMPILWIVGEKDTTFVAKSKGLSFSHPQSEVWIVPKCGHRLPWEQKELFQQKIQQFLGRYGYCG